MKGALIWAAILALATLAAMESYATGPRFRVEHKDPEYRPMGSHGVVKVPRGR